MEWNYHMKSLKLSLNQRLFVIRRLARQIPRGKIISIVHSLWISKLRYGLQLCTRVRQSEQDPKSASLTSLQLTQNRMLRAINNSRIRDRVSVKSMLDKFDLLSVNQLAAQIKLLEVWKSTHVEGHAVVLDPYNCNLSGSGHELRLKSNRIFNDTTRL